MLGTGFTPPPHKYLRKSIISSPARLRSPNPALPTWPLHTLPPKHWCGISLRFIPWGPHVQKYNLFHWTIHGQRSSPSHSLLPTIKPQTKRRMHASMEVDDRRLAKIYQLTSRLHRLLCSSVTRNRPSNNPHTRNSRQTCIPPHYPPHVPSPRKLL